MICKYQLIHRHTHAQLKKTKISNLKDSVIQEVYMGNVGGRKGNKNWCVHITISKNTIKEWVKTCDEPVGPGDYPDSSLTLYVEMMEDTNCRFCKPVSKLKKENNKTKMNWITVKWRTIQRKLLSHLLSQTEPKIKKGISYWQEERADCIFKILVDMNSSWS